MPNFHPEPRALPGTPSTHGLSTRRAFSRFTDRDAELLRGLRAPLQGRMESIIGDFYAHLLRFEPLRPLLGGEDVLERLRGMQRRYLLSLTSGRFADAYLEDRLRIGRVHERIGLHPQWFLGAHCVLLELLAPVVQERYGHDPALTCEAGVALAKVMNLDAQIVLHAYFEARQQRAVAHSESLAAVGELAASIAHEVRNPLAGMKGALEMLRRSLVVEDSRREVMDEVVAQIDRLEGLVRDLLTFARPNPMSHKPVRLEAVLERALRFAQDAGELRGIHVERDFAADAGKMSGDAQQLEEVFLNLIHNAVHSMEGGGTLALSVGGGGDEMTVAVRDTGSGIPQENLRHVFQPFFTTKNRGSGLGLSIVKKIVEAHDGMVRVESEPGTGTIATVTLPRKEAE